MGDEPPTQWVLRRSLRVVVVVVVVVYILVDRIMIKYTMTMANPGLKEPVNPRKPQYSPLDTWNVP